MSIFSSQKRPVEMNRSERRAAQRHLDKTNSRWPATLTEWPRADWPHEGSPNVLGVWRSRDFLVQLYTAPEPALLRISVNRASLSGGEWTDGITWDELQRVKREVGYGGHDAIEVYPPDADVVNVAAIRHLWVLPAGWVPFAWRKS